MERSLISKKVMPFLLMFIALIVTTAILDAALHLLDLTWIGRWLGIPGVLLIMLSFLYSMRKRKKISFGKPKTLLKLHEVLTWTGALMVLVHAGIHVYAILPWLALVAMMVNIISGMTGQYLLDQSRRYIAEKKAHQAEQGLVGDEAERALFWDAVTLDTMKKWRAVHFPITLMFVVLGTTHIFSILLYWQWK
ncbi:MAG: hypothetical protein L3J28_15170 [Candidatus Polarisedimenticolaceae bacterium]|nr:hypothetical protein [Candidatus Polarisedimenticolaceae bacterium]